MVLTRIGIPAARLFIVLIELAFTINNGILLCQIYIGGLRSDSDKYDVEEAFAQYGKVKGPLQ